MSRPDDNSDYTAEEVEALIARSAVLLDQLHAVLGEMTERLQSLSVKGAP